MIKYFYSFVLLFFSFFCCGQTTNFVVVSSSSANNSSAFTVGEIFVKGQLTTSGFLASHLATDIDVGTNEIESNNLNDKITVFPNPSNDIIQFDISADLLVNKRIKVFSILGELVLDELLEGNTISISSLRDGQYIIQLEGFGKATVVVVK